TGTGRPSRRRERGENASADHRREPDDHGIGRAETTRQAARASGEVAVVGVAHSAASPSSGWRTPLAISATASNAPKNSGCGNPIRANPLAAVVGKRNSEPRVQEHRPTGGRIEIGRAHV